MHCPVLAREHSPQHASSDVAACVILRAHLLRFETANLKVKLFCDRSPRFAPSLLASSHCRRHHSLAHHAFLRPPYLIHLPSSQSSRHLRSCSARDLMHRRGIRWQTPPVPGAQPKWTGWRSLCCCTLHHRKRQKQSPHNGAAPPRPDEVRQRGR